MVIPPSVAKAEVAEAATAVTTAETFRNRFFIFDTPSLEVVRKLALREQPLNAEEKPIGQVHRQPERESSGKRINNVSYIERKQKSPLPRNSYNSGKNETRRHSNTFPHDSGQSRVAGDDLRSVRAHVCEQLCDLNIIHKETPFRTAAATIAM